MPAASKSSPRRNADLAMIHMAGKTLFGDVSKGGDGRTDYEAWLKNKTGKSSAGKLTTPERIELIKSLRRDGLIKDRAPAGRGRTASGELRPTPDQWARIAQLSKRVGMGADLRCSRIQAFIEKTAKVQSARFITRTQASDVIVGLERWEKSLGKKQDAVS